MSITIDTILQRSPVIPVLVIDDIEDAVPLARALLEGGVPVLEITFRTAFAADAIRAIKLAVPEAIVGAGTILNASQLQEACSAGADFIVTPGCTTELLTHLQNCGRPFLPGVSTVSEMMTLLEQGVTAMKLFPAEAAGGTALLKAVSGPLPQIVFCPTGGINPDTAAAYLALPNVACVGGSWLATPALMTAKNWSAITDRAQQAANLN